MNVFLNIIFCNVMYYKVFKIDYGIVSNVFLGNFSEFNLKIRKEMKLLNILLKSMNKILKLKYDK